MQRPIRVGIHREAQRIPEVQLQSYEIEEAGALGQIDQEVEVTVRLRLTARVGPEHAGASYAVSAQNGEHLLDECLDRGSHALKIGGFTDRGIGLWLDREAPWPAEAEEPRTPDAARH